MKKIVLFAAVLRIIIITALISFAIFAKAQSVAVNTTGTPADASAKLDISSISKGFLPPRMTTAQRTGISSPTNGLMVFDTDTNTYWYFATTWKEVSIGGGGNFSLSYRDNSSVFSPFSITNTSAVLGSSDIYGGAGIQEAGLYGNTVWHMG